MDHLPPNDRRVSSGAVAAAWALVAGLTAMTAVGSVLAPPRPLPLTEQAALHTGGCTTDEPDAERPDRPDRN